MPHSFALTIRAIAHSKNYADMADMTVLCPGIRPNACESMGRVFELHNTTFVLEQKNCSFLLSHLNAE